MKKFPDKQIENISLDPKAGIYLINKKKGEHSFHAISILRKILNQQKVGFAGTLDPLASGLLIVASGKATKILDAFHALPKVYQANILFGFSSVTYDMEGELVKNEQAKIFTQEDLAKTLENFLGKKLQTVPAYSAVKVGGQKLHQLARKGKFVERPKKEVEIFSLEIKAFDYPRLSLEATVSAGTYIRSFASDLGEALGTSAVLSDLQRTQIGKFSVEQALCLEDLNLDSLKQNSLDLLETIQYLNQHLGR
jgi:tRNA pseudouridine55 synthase